MIEWFRLYPLKKLLLAFIWGFCAYQSVRGFRIVWIEKHQEVLWIELFFLCFTLLTAYNMEIYQNALSLCKVQHECLSVKIGSL